ncbi:MAG: cytochrome c-type biogenesis protein CcmH [Thiomicrospira sp.]|jgi:cytochrome c-type biogenesis protein CcmH|nr:cytochrome c-type biogenesis protein CcmH [Thiomicrospira sp.]
MMRGLLLWLCVFPAWAVVETYTFDTPEQQALYHEMVRELRCVVCQNQNLIESNAPIAQDLRQQLYQMIRYQAATRDDIVGFMTQRYGDFVLYRPPLQANSWLLWFAPVLMFVFGVGLWVQFIRRSQQQGSAHE